MSALAGSGNPAFKPAFGAKIRGVIEGVRDQQARDFTTKQPKFYDAPANTQPIMDVVATLRLPDGSVRDVYVSGKLLKTAVKTAFREAGRSDLEIGDTLGVEVTGKDGNAWTWAADYTVFDPTV